jgi:hypothetical protein
VRQAALGLAHIHASGLVHRDIKPSNMMLTRDGNLKLLDLGLVLSGDDPLSVDDRLTTVGHLMGTMPYMAPEQLIDSRDVDARADIYALGATLYRLIAGRPPHHGHGGLAKQVMAITKQDAPPLDSVRDDLDQELVSLVTSMISRDPAARPQTAEEVAQRLSGLGTGGQLKRLLRQALRSPARETSFVSSFHRSATPAQGDSSKDGSRRRLIALGFGFPLMLLAGFLLKIATDRGELIIQSEHDGVVVTVSQGNELVERLKIEAGGDNRFTLHKGTYEIGIEGATGLALSENVVTIGRGTKAPVEVKAKSAMRLYQGKDLVEWMDLLTREEDPNELGQIMRAVEVLTRDTEERTQAANATLPTARLWGGLSSSPPTPTARSMASKEPSQHFMYHLMETFPRYGSDGLEAIDTELNQGNTKSRIAAIWLLSDLSQGDSAMPPKLVEHLEKAVLEIESDDDRHAYSDKAIELAQGIGIRLLLKQGGAIAGQVWLEDCVRAEVAEAEESWKAHPDTLNFRSGGGGFGSSMKNWVLDETMFAAAMEIEAAGRLRFDWNWVASALLHQRYQRVTDHTDAVFDAVAENAPNKLLDATSVGLSQMLSPIGGFGGGFKVGSKDKFWSGNHRWIPLFSLGSQRSVWPQAVTYYADHTDNPDESIALLEKARELMIQYGADPNHASKPFQWIDAAIEKLQQRREK